jgi:hypothetical protein
LDYNAYVVSSELRAVPIIESETNRAVGQAYNGFAISITDIRNDNAYFYLNISDPSASNVVTRKELYIPLKHMTKAFVEPQAVPAIISLDMIMIKPMAGISLFQQGQQQVIARFNDEVGPIQFVQNVQNGYLFTLGMNLVYVNLGQEFSLRIGESASIKGEELQVRFLEVTEDSRCPTGVVCIWEGRVSGLLEIAYRESLHRAELTEPGLTSWPPEYPFNEYKIAYHVEPYPQAGIEIAVEDYRLVLRISK